MNYIRVAIIPGLSITTKHRFAMEKSQKYLAPFLFLPSILPSFLASLLPSFQILFLSHSHPSFLPFPLFPSFFNLPFGFHSLLISISVSLRVTSFILLCFSLPFLSSLCHVRACKLFTAQGPLAKRRNEGRNPACTLLAGR